MLSAKKLSLLSTLPYRPDAKTCDFPATVWLDKDRVEKSDKRNKTSWWRRWFFRLKGFILTVFILTVL